MKIKLFTISAACMGLATFSMAQSPTLFPDAPAAPSSPLPTAQPTDGSASQPAAPGPASQFPVFDFENETIEYGGSKFSLANNRFAEQFKGYLKQSQESVTEAAGYIETLAQIRDILDYNNKASQQRKIDTVRDLLKKNTELSVDARISDSLLNVLTMAQLSKKNAALTEAEIKKLEEANKRLIRNMAREEDKTDLRARPNTTTGGARGRSAEPVSIQRQENNRVRLELQAKMKKNAIEQTIGKNLAKVQFQAMLMQLFVQRRFEHCIIGCRLYNTVFTDGKNQLSINKGSEVHKLFNERLGVSPTVAGLDSAATEAIGKVKTLTSSVKNHLEHQEVQQATQRMIEAYVIGEHLPLIQTFSPEMRAQMHKFLGNVDYLKQGVEVKNWQVVKEYVDKLKAQASDFSYIKAETAIDGYMTGSNLELAQSFAAQQQRDHERARLHMKAAHDLWPTNPAIKEIEKANTNKIIAGLQQIKTLESERAEFESLHRNQNFENLSIEKAGEYKAAFARAANEDNLSAEQRAEYTDLHLKASEAFDRLYKVAEVIEKADGLSKAKQHYQAWEVMQLEYQKDHIAKRKIQEKLNDLSTRATKFRELFEEAENLIDSENYGPALSRYLKAQTLYPNSELAQQGIDIVMAKSN